MFGRLKQACGARKEPQGFLQRLRSDVRGNVMAMMAAAVLPLIGLMGGALDMSRLYLAKVRLQQACDAGALAGRKVMGGGTWAQNSYAPRTAANQFFAGNFKDGSYGTTGLTSAYSESAGKVSGTASVVVPMTLMKVFSFGDKTLSVTCDAEMRLPNTDIMFVLDTTGSMADTLPSDTKTKIQGLKSAVKCFYEVLARLDTTEVCGSGPGPSGGTGSQIQIRFGFMPYATNVNVGKLLPPSYFAGTWKYQTRQANWNTIGGTSWVVQSNTSSTQAIHQTYAQVYCTQANANNLNNSNSVLNGTVRTTTAVTYTVTGWSGGECYANMTTTVTVEISTNTIKTFKNWNYGQYDVDISDLKNGSSWNSSYSFSLPIGALGTSKTITWDGCIEERTTKPDTTYNPIPSQANDLNIDLVPSQSDAKTLWAPALPELEYLRDSATYYSWGTPYFDTNSLDNSPANNTLAEYYSMNRTSSNYSCPTEAKKLQAWPTASAFESYVDGLQPSGNTYHDIGMLWGSRFISPSGIFTSENAFTPKGGEIERHIIFMTDGDTNTNNTDYNAYGIPWFDRRQWTSQGSAPTSAQTDAQVDARFAAICTAIKNKNVTIWVVGFGNLDSSTVTRLQTCSSDNRFWNPKKTSDLQAAFTSIASQISQLRLTK